MTDMVAGGGVLKDTAAMLDDVMAVVAPPYRARLEAARRKLAESRFVVVGCGEFKRGKTSLLNALLERPGLLPVDVDVATSVPTVVMYGETETASVAFADGTAKPVAVAEVRDYVTEAGNPRNHLGVERVEVRLPDARLARGVVLVDTPGIGGLNVEHTAATLEYMVHADAVLFVASAEEALSTLELNFLADAARYSDLLVVAVTKMDRSSRPEVLVDDARRKIATRLEIPPDELIIVPVSSQRKLNGLREADAALVAKSGFAQLEDELWGGIRRRAGVAVTMQALEEAGRALELTAKPIGTEIVALETDSAAARRQMATELEALRQRAAKLDGSTTEWRSVCAATLDEVRTSVLELFEADVTAVRHNINAYVRDERLVDDPEALGSKIVHDLRLALADAESHLRGSITELVVRLRRQTSFELTDPRLAVLSFDPINGLYVPPPPERATASRRILDAGPKAIAGGKTYRRLGALLGGALMAGGLVLPPLLLVGGAIVAGTTVTGTVAGFRNSLIEMDELAGQERLAALTECVTEFLETNHRRVRLMLTESVSHARQGVVADLEERVRAEERSLRDAEAALQRAASAGDDNTGRLRTLKERLATLTALQNRVDALLARTTAGR